MENIMKFVKKNKVLLLSIVGGVLLLIAIGSFAFGRHDRYGRFERGFWPQQFGACGAEKWGFGKWWQEAGCPFVGWPWMMWALPWGPGMMWGPGEEKMQKHMCQSGSLENGAVQQLLIGLDMKINSLNLIKENMQSMAQRTNIAYSTGDMATLDQLLSWFDAQRKLLESNPESFCTATGTWTTLNEDMRKLMMEGVSGQVNRFREEAKRWGPGMMRWRFGR